MVTNQIVSFPVTSVDDSPIYDMVLTRSLLPVTTLAVEVEFFEKLSKQPMTIDEIASSYSVSVRSAEAMVVVQAALGFVSPDEHGKFFITPVAETYLLRSSPFFRGRLFSKDDPLLKQMRRAFATENKSDRIAVNMDTHNDERIRTFIEAMHSMVLPASGGLAKQSVFTKIKTLLDVGGGSGVLSCAIAAFHSHINSTILELDLVSNATAKYVADYNLQDRITVKPGDMFTSNWPTRDAILFGNIFHDWDVDTCISLAKKAYEALEPGGYIMLHEIPLNDTKDGPLVAACFSIEMLLYEKGKQYSHSEFKEMLNSVGFVEFNSVNTFGYYYLFTARKPA